MPFDPQQFEAEVALKLIPTEEMPQVAQYAMEAGYDGPAVVRMAILEGNSGWAIDQALVGMLAELGLSSIDSSAAALRLARKRAERILSTENGDPLQSIRYFHQLMLAADYLTELNELAYLDDEFYFYTDNPEEQRAIALSELENLLFPELREGKRIKNEMAWKLKREETERDWPYVFNSPGMRALLRQRFLEQLKESRPLIPLLVAAAGITWWGFESWRFAVIYLGCVFALIPLLGILGAVSKA